jgi:hypothetical protein
MLTNESKRLQPQDDKAQIEREMAALPWRRRQLVLNFLHFVTIDVESKQKLQKKRKMAKLHPRLVARLPGLVVPAASMPKALPSVASFSSRTWTYRGSLPMSSLGVCSGRIHLRRKLRSNRHGNADRNSGFWSPSRFVFTIHDRGLPARPIGLPTC